MLAMQGGMDTALARLGASRDHLGGTERKRSGRVFTAPRTLNILSTGPLHGRHVLNMARVPAREASRSQGTACVTISRRKDPPHAVGLRGRRGHASSLSNKK